MPRGPRLNRIISDLLLVKQAACKALSSASSEATVQLSHGGCPSRMGRRTAPPPLYRAGQVKMVASRNSPADASGHQRLVKCCFSRIPECAGPPSALAAGGRASGAAELDVGARREWCAP